MYRYNNSNNTSSSNQTNPDSSFSMLFSLSHNNNNPYYNYETTDISSSSSVDCTLSLGTPSTRSSNARDYNKKHSRKSTSSCIWDISSLSLSSTTTTTANHHKSSGRTGGNVCCDPLVARRCANCDTTSTPLWRNGPKGPKSLCNACGIRFKKEERRSATTINNTNPGSVMQPQNTTDSEIPFLYWRLNVTDKPSFVQDFTRY